MSEEFAPTLAPLHATTRRLVLAAPLVAGRVSTFASIMYFVLVCTFWMKGAGGE